MKAEQKSDTKSKSHISEVINKAKVKRILHQNQIDKPYMGVEMLG